MDKLKLSDNTAKLHQMFGKRLYSDKYSFICEICQNAVDSHRMAGQKEYVKVGIRMASPGCYFFYVKDTGLSFEDKEDFTKKVLTILESGKSEDKSDGNAPMGMHGIGSISVSAFHSEWAYVVVKNKRKFLCVIREVDGVGLTYKFGPYKETNEEDSVFFEVAIPASIPIEEFTTNMIGKLAYFTDVKFEFCENTRAADKKLLTLNHDFKVFRGEDFQVSTICPSTAMHICLDQYKYPIYWEKLGMDPINANVGLRFSLNDGLNPDINRENIIFDDNYKAIIKAKIKKVSEWFVEYYHKVYPPVVDSVKAYKQRVAETKTVPIGEMTITINDMIPHSKLDMKPTSFKGVSKFVMSRFALHTNYGDKLYRYMGETTDAGVKMRRSYFAFRQDERILFDKQPTVRQSAYLKVKEMEGYGVYARNKTQLLKGDFSYKNILGLSKTVLKRSIMDTGTSAWREQIKEFQILERSYEKDYYIKVTEMKIPDSFKTAPRRAPVRKGSEEIGIKYGKEMERRVGNWSCKFDERTVKVRDLHKLKFLHIFGNEGDRDKLDFIWKLGARGAHNTMSPCIITDRHQSKIKDLHNFIHVDEFLAGKHLAIGKLVTAYYIERMLSSVSQTLYRKSEISTYLSSTFVDEVEDLRKYEAKYDIAYFDSKNEMLKNVLKMAKERKLYDHSILEKYRRVKKKAKLLDFVQHFGYIGVSSHSAIKALQDIARYRKIKMDLKHYKKSTNEVSD